MARDLRIAALAAHRSPFAAYRLLRDMDRKLLDILVCPLCKGPLVYKTGVELICKPCRLAYPITDDIPVMLEDEARKLPPEEEV